MRSGSRLVLLTLLVAAPAFAFPWMARHYGSCAACHVDPSGAGQLTPYGRAQAENLLRFKAVTPKPGEEAEVPPSALFLWGLELPEALNLSGNLRAGPYVRPEAAVPVIPLVMATDLSGTVSLGDVVLHLTAGLGLKRSEKAAVFPVCDPAKQVEANPEDPNAGACPAQLVSREFWAGLKLADESVLLRAGRLNLPFGLRNNEHTTWVRELSRTNINTDQQTGVAVAYNTEALRGEVMGIAGNFQVSPDAYRERGYSLFGEYALGERTYVGVSSLVVSSGADLETQLPTTRHAHGAFFRASPLMPLVLMGEADLLVTQTKRALDLVGFAALLQADLELHQGVHAVAMLEGMHHGDGAAAPAVGAWLGVLVFPLPHLEVRVDAIYRVVTSAGGTSAADLSFLAQLHLFL